MLKMLKRNFYTPVIITFFIVLSSICLLVISALFFNSSMKGTWRIHFKLDDKDYTHYLTILDHDKFTYSFGGVTYDGKYTADTTQKTLYLFSSSYGHDNLNSNFKYSVSGNIFTGREISLTNSENTELPFKKSDDYIPVIKYYSDFKPDESLLGSWLYEDEKQGYNYTFTFYNDGRYEYLCSGTRHIGAYRTDGKNFTYNLVVDGGDVNEESLKFSLQNGTLCFIKDDLTDVLTKTNNKFSFENEIK